MKTRLTSRCASGEERRGAGTAQAGAQSRQAPAAMPDARAASLAQLQHQERASNSSLAAQMMARADVMAGRGADAPMQRVEDVELLQAKREPAQREEDEELLQGKFAARPTVQLEEKPNSTGMPNQLKAGIESLSGMNMDHVRVHYNSDKPAQLNAHAYAQGSEIHMAPGQEQHLPHEAWHVVQQAQGRVKPTMQMKQAIPVNDDQSLEMEADVMGAKALACVDRPTQLAAERTSQPRRNAGDDAVQRNAFLTSLANPANQIDYAAISVAGATTPGGKLYTAIFDAMNKSRRRQAVLQAIEARNLTAEFIAYTVVQNWTLGSLASYGQDIRSSHSGGAIDSNLPQPAYEAAPVAGGGLTVSVAPPALNTLADQVNYAWLEDSTTSHTTDPDHPQYRGPTSPTGAPTLGATVGGGVGANNRLASGPNRVASYFELGVHNITEANGGGVSGTRVVFDPFNDRHFVSEHYARQYELINVPAANAHAAFATVDTRIANTLAHGAYTVALAPLQLNMRRINIYKYVMDGIQAGTF